MKKLVYTLLASGLIISCADKQEENTSSLVQDNVEILTKNEKVEEEVLAEQVNAISLWKSAGLYSKSGKSNKENKWKLSVPFGSQLLILEEVEVGNKDYARVKTKEGKEGWISTYLIRINAHIAVVTNDVRLYKSADILSMSDTKIEKGTILVVDNEKIESYVGVVTKEKKANGFLKSDKSLSVELVDLEVAQLRKRALALDGDKKVEALKEIIDNSEYLKSVFYDELSEILSKLNEAQAEEPYTTELVDHEQDMNPDVDNITTEITTKSYPKSQSKQSMDNNVEVSEAE